MILYEVQSYFGGPYERGTHVVHTVNHGYILADSKKKAEALARSKYNIPSDFVLSLHRVSVRDARELAEKVERWREQAYTVSQWLSMIETT